MAGSTYQFLAGLGKKIPQKVLNNEYNRIYKNLVRSVRGYAKRGFDVMFFDIPDKPKKITPGSLKKLQKAVNEWHYYTGRGSVDVSQLGPNVQSSSYTANNQRYEEGTVHFYMPKHHRRLHVASYSGLFSKCGSFGNQASWMWLSLQLVAIRIGHMVMGP